MSVSLEIVSNWVHGGEQLRQVYVESVKNTFIDITLKHEGPKRSSSCSARCDGLANMELAKEDPPAAKEGSPAKMTFHRRMSEMKARLPLLEPWSKNCDAIMSGSGTASTALPFSASTRTSLSDDGASAQVRDEFLEEQYQKYFINTDNSGQTLMWHGMPTKYQVEPHLIGILDAIEAENVGYLYLPLNQWEKLDNPNGKCRNKGYAFIHFRTEASASDFMQKISDYESEKRRLAATTNATTQGISANLRMLVAAPQKRTISGSLYLPNQVGKLERLSIHALRERSMRPRDFSLTQQ
jgi:hypothetical protein